MTQEEFSQIIRSFDEDETLRSALYFRALRLIEAGFVIEAHILILSTWNFARFRYVMRSFDLGAYEETVEAISGRLSGLSGTDLMDLDLAAWRDTIVGAYDELAGIGGVEFTGASKILHLMQPSVFVMWDRAISGAYSRRSYNTLRVVSSGFWANRSFGLSGRGYYDFLAYCQQRFRGFASPTPNKTLAKCIDEFNFCEITLPLQEGT